MLDSGTAGVPVSLMLLQGNGPVFFAIEDSNNSSRWNMSNNNPAGDYLMTKQGDTGIFTFEGDGDLRITGQLFTGTGNTCDVGCDRVFSPDYDLPSIEEHAAEMWANNHLPAVGPTPEDANAPFNVTAKTAGILNELEKAHIYIEQLHQRLSEKESDLDAVTERLERLEALLAGQSN